MNDKMLVKKFMKIMNLPENTKLKYVVKDSNSLKIHTADGFGFMFTYKSDIYWSIETLPKYYKESK